MFNGKEIKEEKRKRRKSDGKMGISKKRIAVEKKKIKAGVKQQNKKK